MDEKSTYFGKGLWAKDRIIAFFVDRFKSAGDPGLVVFAMPDDPGGFIPEVRPARSPEDFYILAQNRSSTRICTQGLPLPIGFGGMNNGFPLFFSLPDIRQD